MDYGKQHFVSECYLKAWCDPSAPKDRTPYLWLFSKDGEKVRKKAPSSIFHEREMYTIAGRDGSRNLVLEHGLSQLEALFSTLRDQKLIERRPLSEEERLALCAFVAAAHARTKAQRDHLKEQWSRPLEMMEKMLEWSRKTPPEEKRSMMSFWPQTPSRNPGISYEQVKRLVAQPLQEMLAILINTETPLLAKLDLAILETENSPGFITSDVPCIWYDPEWYKRPPFYQSPALIYPTIEITLPITPRLMLYLNRGGFNGYLPTRESTIDELNRRYRFYAREHFVVNANVKNDLWFQKGEEPEDSWRKQHQKGSSGEIPE